MSDTHDAQSSITSPEETLRLITRADRLLRAAGDVDLCLTSSTPGYDTDWEMHAEQGSTSWLPTAADDLSPALAQALSPTGRLRRPFDLDHIDSMEVPDSGPDCWGFHVTRL